MGRTACWSMPTMSTRCRRPSSPFSRTRSSRNGWRQAGAPPWPGTSGAMFARFGSGCSRTRGHRPRGRRRTDHSGRGGPTEVADRFPDLPRFSIIMPVRNEAGYIARAVESIRAQTLDGAFEVIVVDGQSTDGTRETIESWCRSDARVRLLDNPRRITPTALNVAVGACRGDTVVRIDGH